MHLLEKYAPTSTSELIGNKEAIAKLKQWFLSFQLNKTKKPLLIYGPVGCGKSAAIKALAKEFNSNIIFVEPPSDENELKKLNRLKEIFVSYSFSGEKPILVFENIDGWGQEKAKFAQSALSDLLKNPQGPIILTANDLYDKSIFSLRYYCEPLQFKSPVKNDIFLLLLKISQEEKMYISKENLKQIANNSNGDIRAAINDLEAHNFFSSRDQEKNTFELLRALFRIKNYSEAINLSFLAGSTTEKESFKLFLAENIPLEFEGVAELSLAYDYLSKADVFDGRIFRTQYWGYLRYSYALIFFAIPLSRQQPNYNFVQYKFPSFLLKMSNSKTKRGLRAQILYKLAKKLHTTSNKAANFIWLFNLFFSLSSKNKSSLEALTSQLNFSYSLNEDEIAYLKEVSF